MENLERFYTYTHICLKACFTSIKSLKNWMNSFLKYHLRKIKIVWQSVLDTYQIKKLLGYCVFYCLDIWHGAYFRNEHFCVQDGQTQKDFLLCSTLICFETIGRYILIRSCFDQVQTFFVSAGAGFLRPLKNCVVIKQTCLLWIKSLKPFFFCLEFSCKRKINIIQELMQIEKRQKIVPFKSDIVLPEI